MLTHGDGQRRYVVLSCISPGGFQCHTHIPRQDLLVKEKVSKFIVNSPALAHRQAEPTVKSVLFQLPLIVAISTW